MTIADRPRASACAPPPPHERESERLDALRQTGLLDSAASSRFDALTELAKHVFDVPIALISLVDSDRQWFLSRQGLDVDETPRDIAFCAYAIHEPDMLVIDDAREHPILRANPLVTGSPGIRFYAGAVLRSPQGLPLGTLCVIDTQPRALDAHARTTLASMARLAQSEMLLPEDISARRAMAQIGTSRDPITGRLWGDALFDRIEARRARQPAAGHVAVSVHLESMGYFANMYGRLVADEIAIAVCERIERALAMQGHELLARLDSDWFAGVVTVADESDLEATLERLRAGLTDALARPLKTSVGRLYIRAAIGLAALSEQARSAEQTVRLCRLAAAELSEPADVRVVVVDGVLKSAALRRQRLAADLSDAIRDDALSLRFQPKFDAESQRIAGLECLLRWQHPTLGLVLPTEIVAVASEVGHTSRLDRWVLSRAIERVADWQQRGLSYGRLSINVTTTTLVDMSFTGWLRGTLRQHGVGASSIDLEIVESAVVSDFDATVRVMQHLCADGVTFSLDDFGTGFSSLAILRELPVSTLKIDKSFVEQVGTDARAASLCSGIVNLAHELGLNTVAEGVETASQSGILRALNCDQLQGFCFSEPLTAGDIERRYSEGVKADA